MSKFVLKIINTILFNKKFINHLGGTIMNNLVEVEVKEPERCLPSLEGTYLAKDESGQPIEVDIISKAEIVPGQKGKRKNVFYISDWFGKDGNLMTAFDSGLDFFAFLRPKGPLPEDCGHY